MADKADKKAKAVTVNEKKDQTGVDITATLVSGKDKGILIFIPGDFTKPADLDDMGKVKRVLRTESWLTFPSVVKGWDLVGGMHWGFAKPRKKS